MGDKQYNDFKVSVMWCSRCNKATNAREFLVIKTNDGKYYSCFCEECGIQVGTKTEGNISIDGIF